MHRERWSTPTLRCFISSSKLQHTNKSIRVLVRINCSSYSTVEMVLQNPPQSPASVFIVVLLLALPLITLCSHGDVKVRLLRTPPSFSAKSLAVFSFEVIEGSKRSLCTSCVVTCKLDNFRPSACSNVGKEFYTGLKDGNHTFTVCAANSSQGGVTPSCATYDWAVDTVPPTASVRAESSFTHTTNVSVQITFSEPCSSNVGFTCSPKDCDLIVYGAGRVLPSTLMVLQPGMEYAIVVEISPTVQYGRLFLAMEKHFCADAAGNRFTRTSNSTFVLHFDRRDVSMNITALVPTKIVKLNGVSRTVEATNNAKNLKIYLSFSDPVLNTSEQILGQLHTTSGVLFPTRSSPGNRRFGYMLNSTSSMAVLTVSCDANSIISREGTSVSSSASFTFLYDTERPTIKLATAEMRTTRHNISVFVEFEKPVFGFNSSAILVTGGKLLRYHPQSMSLYHIMIQATDKLVSVKVAENAARDVAGNLNVASNVLQVRHYSVPMVSSVLSCIITVIFLGTATVAALLSVSTSSLVSSGAFSRPSSILISEPSRNILRIACHIQAFALSRWLSVNLPIEYYEFAKGIEWTIPHLPLPWEPVSADPFIGYASLPAVAYSELLDSTRVGSLFTNSVQAHGELPIQSPLEGTPLTAMEYRSLFENQNLIPDAPFVKNLEDSSGGWMLFGRNMFWLVVIGGGLVLLHAAIVLILSHKNKGKDKRPDLGALVFPRFEVILVTLALPCMCQAAAALIRGGWTSGLIVGITLMGILTSLLIALLLFLSLGITMAKILQYKEVHHLGQEYHWYQEIIRRTLGPGKRGQWTWKDDNNTACLTKLGPLFEDLRGPPKYMLTQIGDRRKDVQERIIASEDENEDAEAPFIQKLFGILRIYYTFLEAAKRATLGIVAGSHAASSSSRIRGAVAMLSITAFQLGFMMLKKPFIKKRLQLVEIVAVASEVFLFGACVAVVENDDLSEEAESRIGIAILAAFVAMFAAEMINELWALYGQIVVLSPERNSFVKGLKLASTGLLLVVLPAGLFDLKQQLSSNNAAAAAGGGLVSELNSSQMQQQILGSSGERSSWLRQLREAAKAGFTRDMGPNDPSSSRGPFWGGKRSRSSSVTSSADFKAQTAKGKSKGLHKDLEAIFSTTSDNPENQ